MIKKGIYKHFKGNKYEVLFTAKHSEDLSEMVVYKALCGDGGIWIRPIEMWNEEVEYEGKKVKRFTLVEE